MKLRNLLALGISLFAFGGLTAADDCYRCDPCPSLCDTCDPCEGWSAHVDWLYWKVRKSGLDYVISERFEFDTAVFYPNDKIHCLEPCRDSGVRVGVFKACDDFDFGLRYTYFTSEDKESKRGTDLLPTRGHPLIVNTFGLEPIDFASSKYCVDLNQIELEGGYLFRTECDGLLRPFAGVRFSFIDQDLKTIYDEFLLTISLVDEALLITEKLDMDAYGLYVGMEGNLEGWCNVGLYGRFSAGLSLGDFSAGHTEYDVSLGLLGQYDDVRVELFHMKEECWYVVPVWEFAVGLTYDFCDFMCADWNVAVGYEFHDWCCLPDFINFDDAIVPGHLARNRSNLGFDGLFVRLGAAF